MSSTRKQSPSSHYLSLGNEPFCCCFAVDMALLLLASWFALVAVESDVKYHCAHSFLRNKTRGMRVHISAV